MAVFVLHMGTESTNWTNDIFSPMFVYHLPQMVASPYYSDTNVVCYLVTNNDFLMSLIMDEELLKTSNKSNLHGSLMGIYIFPRAFPNIICQ